MSAFSLFEELGLEVPAEEIKKAVTGGTGKKSTGKDAKKQTAVTEEKLTFPLTVLTGVCPATTLTKDMVGDADTLEKVADYVRSQTGMPKLFTIAKRFSDSKIAVILDRGKAQAKGEFEITEVSTVAIGSEEISLHEIIGKRTAKQICDYIREKTGDETPYQFIADKSKLYAVIGDREAAGKVSLPVSIKSPLGDMVLGVEDFDDVDGNEVYISDIENKVFSAADYAELKPILVLYGPYDVKEESILYVGVRQLTRDIPKSASTASKETTYPTDAVISLIFNKIPLSPEMFGGKKRITEKEVVEFLSKDYPEFTPQRTRLTYDKDGNFIFPTLKSSSKGADMYDSREECVAAAKKHPVYFLANYKEDGVEYRYEKTPVSVIEASYEGKGGRFVWSLPKIPIKMLDAIRLFFARVTEEYEVEALVHIGYEPEQGKYVLNLPQQHVRKDSVTTEDMMVSTFEIYHVMDIHSHNTMPAFFSSRDNADEKANRVYGVMGNLDADEPQMKFRAGTGGRFVPLAVSDVFSERTESGAEYDEWFSGRDVCSVADELYDEWLDYAATILL